MSSTSSLPSANFINQDVSTGAYWATGGDGSWSLLAAGKADSTSLTSYNKNDNEIKTGDNGGGYIAGELNDISKIHAALEAKINADYTSNRDALDNAYTEAQAEADQADADVQTITDLLTGLKTRLNGGVTKTSEETAAITKRIAFANAALEAAQKKQSDIHIQVEVLRQIKTAYEDGLDKAKEAQDQFDQDKDKANKAAGAAKEKGGTTDSATKRDTEAQEAATDAEKKVQELKDAESAVETAISDAKYAGASYTQLRKLEKIRDTIKAQRDKAETDLKEIEKDKEKTAQALTDAQAADTAKQKKESSDFEKKITDLIGKIKDVTTQASLQNVRDMYSASQIAAQQMAITGQATITQAQISLASEKMTVQQQLSELAMRAGATGYSNLLAQMAYVEAVREKAFNLQADIDKNRLDNAFTRAKAAAQLSKY